MPDKFLSINNILDRYGFSRTTFFKIRKSGDFPCSITPKNCSPRWALHDLLHWERKNYSSNNQCVLED